MPGVRFAPSPTGRFHIGNLRTAWISHFWAKHLRAPWVIRFEDIDTPRVLPAAREQQLTDLAALRLKPDSVIVQSERHSRHWSLFEKARAAGAVYRCTCSRQEVQQEIESMASAPHAPPPLYSGKCRAQASTQATANPTVAWRFKNPHDPSGRQDFIMARTPTAGFSEADFTPAYHWACAIDDHDGDYELLVRAWDLESVLSAQRLIHRWVAELEGHNRPPAPVFHTALVVQNDGRRLEKRTAGVTLPELESKGISPVRLTQVFEKSLHCPAPNEPGEISRQITLAGLGL